MDGWIKSKESEKLDNSSKYYSEKLSLLGLSGKPNNEEIKKAFRKKLLEFHPDRNPNNPEANNKTIEIINAYEELTGEDAQRVFNGLENQEYYYKVTKTIKKFNITKENFGTSEAGKPLRFCLPAIKCTIKPTPMKYKTAGIKAIFIIST